VRGDKSGAEKVLDTAWTSTIVSEQCEMATSFFIASEWIEALRVRRGSLSGGECVSTVQSNSPYLGYKPKDYSNTITLISHDSYHIQQSQPLLGMTSKPPPKSALRQHRLPSTDPHHGHHDCSQHAYATQDLHKHEASPPDFVAKIAQT
jgi:hypothetical protein